MTTRNSGQCDEYIYNDRGDSLVSAREVFLNFFVDHFCRVGKMVSFEGVGKMSLVRLLVSVMQGLESGRLREFGLTCGVQDIGADRASENWHVWRWREIENMAVWRVANCMGPRGKK